jgi:hypothetical protein
VTNGPFLGGGGRVLEGRLSGVDLFWCQPDRVRSACAIWTIRFVAPESESLSKGEYDFSGFSVDSATLPPAIVFNVGDFSCASVSGYFRVLELNLDARGVVQSFTVDFEQRCDNTPSDLIAGCVRYVKD